MRSYMNEDKKAPTGRKVTARGNALGSNVHTVPIAPRSNIVRGSAVAWGKTDHSYLFVDFNVILFDGSQLEAQKVMEEVVCN